MARSGWKKVESFCIHQRGKIILVVVVVSDDGGLDDDAGKCKMPQLIFRRRGCSMSKGKERRERDGSMAECADWEGCKSIVERSNFSE